MATNAVAAIALVHTIATKGTALIISLPDDERTSLLSNTPCQGRGESFVRSLAFWLKSREAAQVAIESARAASHTRPYARKSAARCQCRSNVKTEGPAPTRPN
jgi:hypothetical protein